MVWITFIMIFTLYDTTGLKGMFNAAIKVIFKEAFQNLNRSMRPLEI